MYGCHRQGSLLSPAGPTFYWGRKGEIRKWRQHDTDGCSVRHTCSRISSRCDAVPTPARSGRCCGARGCIPRTWMPGVPHGEKGHCPAVTQARSLAREESLETKEVARPCKESAELWQ